MKSPQYFLFPCEMLTLLLFFFLWKDIITSDCHMKVNLTFNCLVKSSHYFLKSCEKFTLLLNSKFPCEKLTILLFPCERSQCFWLPYKKFTLLLKVLWKVHITSDFLISLWKDHITSYFPVKRSHCFWLPYESFHYYLLSNKINMTTNCLVKNLHYF